MEWQQLVGFYQVAKLGSFTRAAEATLRTQSALSQQIKALETEFECLLFERIGKRRLRLTVEGERFLLCAESILQQFESFKEDLAELKGAPKGHLRLAAPFTTLYHLFPSIIKSYTEQFPFVEVTILDRPQDMVIDLVKEGEVDFGLALASQVPADLVSIDWKTVKTMLMTPPEHPLTRLKKIRLRDIAKYPLILPPATLKHSCRLKLEKDFKRQGLTYRIVMESSNVELSSLYVEMGHGISFATVVSGLPALQQRKLAFLPLEDLFEGDRIALVHRKDKAFPNHKKAFMETILHEPLPV